MNAHKQIKRGDIFYADLSPVVGSEQGGTRPVLIIQNDVGNAYSRTVIIATITARKDKNPLPTHIHIDGKKCGLKKESLVLLERIRTIDRSRLLEYIGRLDEQTMEKVNTALLVSFELYQ